MLDWLLNKPMLMAFLEGPFWLIHPATLAFTVLYLLITILVRYIENRFVAIQAKEQGHTVKSVNIVSSAVSTTMLTAILVVGVFLLYPFLMGYQTEPLSLMAVVAYWKLVLFVFGITLLLTLGILRLPVINFLVSLMPAVSLFIQLWLTFRSLAYFYDHNQALHTFMVGQVYPSFLQTGIVLAICWLALFVITVLTQALVGILPVIGGRLGAFIQHLLDVLFAIVPFLMMVTFVRTALAMG